ncbi:uncharacterized protein Triagg1_936 [Trichoderma aggressivum f. europaeum]|uniref:Uncharacterized protein n=1 Tax=Trichoderma aggressivum f. europaeum TaxID=173218 RepID=A0AAE1M371_9HYPO|nr:hypothetical protein Triagg1_936 [Trichoderma aggressivum f. europaeum]
MCFEDFAYCKYCDYTVQQKEFCRGYRLEWAQVLIGQSNKTSKQIEDECKKYVNCIFFYYLGECPRCSNPPPLDRIHEQISWAFKSPKEFTGEVPKKYDVIQGEVCSCGCYQREIKK